MVSDRNRQLLAMLETGAYSIQAVADRFGISRQRAHQIYQRECGRYYRPVRKTYRALHPVICKECSRASVARGYCARHYEQQMYRQNSIWRQRRKMANERWRKAHPEQARVIQQRTSLRYYWLHYDEIAKWRKKHRHQERERSRRYYQEHREKINARDRARYWAKKQTKTAN